MWLFFIVLVSLLDILDIRLAGYVNGLPLINGHVLTPLDIILHSDTSVCVCGKDFNFTQNLAWISKMAPKKGKGKSKKSSKGPRSSVTVKTAQQDVVTESYVVDTVDEDTDHVETVEDYVCAVSSGVENKLSVPKPPQKENVPNIQPQDLSSSGGSLPSLAEVPMKRDYIKSDLTSEQEGQILDWWRENTCLYDKTHRQSHNTKYKELLKRELAEKMGINGRLYIYLLCFNLPLNNVQWLKNRQMFCTKSVIFISSQCFFTL